NSSNQTPLELATTLKIDVNALTNGQTSTSSSLPTTSADVAKPQEPPTEAKPSSLPNSVVPASISSNIAVATPTQPVQKDELTVFLESIQMEKYVQMFRHEDVDFATLLQLKETDLEKLGLPLGISIVYTVFHSFNRSQKEDHCKDL